MHSVVCIAVTPHVHTRDHRPIFCCWMSLIVRFGLCVCCCCVEIRTTGVTKDCFSHTIAHRGYLHHDQGEVCGSAHEPCGILPSHPAILGHARAGEMHQHRRHIIGVLFRPQYRRHIIGGLFPFPISKTFYWWVIFLRTHAIYATSQLAEVI